ncbi:MAG: type IV pilus assembly protein PilM [Planctomycetota bacterium]|nr:type IV pilus assembly protein PilM [Planctomycetota bacterium]
MIRSKKSVVGLDLGSSVVTAVELTLEGNEPVITGFSRVELPPGGSVDEAVKQVFKEGKFRSKRVVTGVSGQDTVVRYLSMPRMTDEELRQAIQFEADKLVASDEEFIIDCAPLGTIDGDEAADPAAGEMKVLVAACPRARLEGQASMISEAGLTPIAIDLDMFAVANAWELCVLPDADGADAEDVRATALVDVGAKTTSINVMRGGVSCFSREIPIGGANMTQAVSRRLGVEGFEAEAIKRAGEDHQAEVRTAIAPVLEDLSSELALSMDYVEHNEGVTVTEILLSGGGVLAPGAVEAIEQSSARPTRTWNPLEGLHVDVDRLDVEELEAWAPSLVVAVGLASRVRHQ